MFDVSAVVAPPTCGECSYLSGLLGYGQTASEVRATLAPPSEIHSSFWAVLSSRQRGTQSETNRKWDERKSSSNAASLHFSGSLQHLKLMLWPGIGNALWVFRTFHEVRPGGGFRDVRLIWRQLNCGDRNKMRIREAGSHFQVISCLTDRVARHLQRRCSSFLEKKKIISHSAAQS